MERDVSVPDKVRRLTFVSFGESSSKRVIGERYFPAVRADDVGKSLIDFVTQHGAEQLAESLTLLHDWILYDSRRAATLFQKLRFFLLLLRGLIY